MESGGIINNGGGKGVSPTEDTFMWTQQLFESLVGTSWFELGIILLASVVIYIVTLLLVRLMGLRSLSRISSFDYTVTIAMGAVLGSTVVSSQVGLLEGLLALATLLGLQRAVAFARQTWGWAQVIDNHPLLLLEDGTVLEGNLQRANVTKVELMTSLRTAGVRNLGEVAAVVMEPTGVISVISEDPESSLDPELLADVDRGEAG